MFEKYKRIEESRIYVKFLNEICHFFFNYGAVHIIGKFNSVVETNITGR